MLCQIYQPEFLEKFDIILKIYPETCYAFFQSALYFIVFFYKNSKFFCSSFMAQGKMNTFIAGKLRKNTFEFMLFLIQVLAFSGNIGCFNEIVQFTDSHGQLKVKIFQ